VATGFNMRLLRTGGPSGQASGREKDPIDAVSARGGASWTAPTPGRSWQARAGCFEFAVAADPKSIEASAGLGAGRTSLEFYYFHSAAPRDKLDAAEKALKHALELGPDHPQNLAAWADMLFLRQKPGEAFWVWRKALEVSPVSAYAHVRLASALVKQGRLRRGGVKPHGPGCPTSGPIQMRRQWLRPEHGRLGIRPGQGR
jgi:tetratricopeptide (TPR) repeat protein